ncbi:MAG: lipocalin family protein [Ferruginibacter sp.]
MSKTIISFVLLFALSAYADAQITDSLIGKWKFKDIYNAEKMDSSQVSMLRKGFANMSIYLKENKHYKTFLFSKEEGEWQFDEATKKLLMTANKGTENQMGIISVTGTTLVLNIGKDKSMILERTTPDKSDEIEEIVYNGPLVSATKEQICKKWYIVKREVPGRSEESLKTATDLIKGAFFEIQPDQTYTAEVLKLNDEGNWKFGEGNKSILMTSGKEHKFWQIRTVNDKELVLVKGNSNELWTFSANP